MNGLHELETELRAAVREIRWMVRVWNAADRVAGVTGELAYAEPDEEVPLLVPVAAAMNQPTD